MSAPDLNAIRARAAAATKGPWEVERWEDFGGSPSYSIPGAERFREYRNSIECGEDEATAEFIAHARQDIPALCDEVEQLRQSIAVTGGLYRSAESDVTQIMAAMTELVHHGDLTLFGRRVLERIIGGGE